MLVDVLSGASADAGSIPAASIRLRLTQAVPADVLQGATSDEARSKRCLFDP